MGGDVKMMLFGRKKKKSVYVWNPWNPLYRICFTLQECEKKIRFLQVSMILWFYDSICRCNLVRVFWYIISKWDTTVTETCYNSLFPFVPQSASHNFLADLRYILDLWNIQCFIATALTSKRFSGDLKKSFRSRWTQNLLPHDSE